jgi:hypothetical protein
MPRTVITVIWVIYESYIEKMMGTLAGHIRSSAI